MVPMELWNPSSCDYMTEFSLLVHYALSINLQRVSHRQLKLALDGPYGYQISFGDYDSVILIANGKGIAGVLSFALLILSRNKQDKQDKERGAKNNTLL